MKRSIWRGAVVAAAVGALAVGFVPAASAGVPISPDPSPGLKVPATVDTFRIAGNTRIQTAIEAANVRTDWGRGQVKAIFKCSPSGVGQDNQTAAANFTIGVPVTFPIVVNGVQVNQTCTPTVVNTQIKDVVIARDSDFPDALASAPLADVLNAPVLLNPTDAHPASGDTRGLNDDVLAYLTAQRTTAGLFVVHLMGGTNALSADVQTQINALGPNVLVVRHQGADRYQTAVSVGIDTIISQILNWLVLTGGRGPVPSFGNVYLTTGLNFPDALTAGAAASNNSGVVLLTKGDVFDKNPSGNSFTFDFIAALPNTIISFFSGLNIPFNNTPENFAVGGPAVAAAHSAGLNLAAEYNGVNRYETATLVADGTFKEPFIGKNYFAVASGTNYPDAVVAAGFIANLDGPLLLSDPTDLYRAFGNPTGNPFTAAYLQANANNQDLVFVFGGTGSLNQNVQDQIEHVLNF